MVRSAEQTMIRILPLPQVGRPFPEPLSAEGFFLLKARFSFPLSLSACSQSVIKAPDMAAVVFLL